MREKCSRVSSSSTLRNLLSDCSSAETGWGCGCGGLLRGLIEDRGSSSSSSSGSDESVSPPLSCVLLESQALDFHWGTVLVIHLLPPLGLDSCCNRKRFCLTFSTASSMESSESEGRVPCLESPDSWREGMPRMLCRCDGEERNRRARRVGRLWKTAFTHITGKLVDGNKGVSGHPTSHPPKIQERKSAAPWLAESKSFHPRARKGCRGGQGTGITYSTCTTHDR